MRELDAASLLEENKRIHREYCRLTGWNSALLRVVHQSEAFFACADSENDPEKLARLVRELRNATDQAKKYAFYTEAI